MHYREYYFGTELGIKIEQILYICIQEFIN